MPIPFISGTRLRALAAATFCLAGASSATSAADLPLSGKPSSAGPLGGVTTIINTTLAQTGALLGSGVGTDPSSGSGIGEIISRTSGNYVVPTAGTNAIESYIYSDGLARRYILIRPTTGNGGAPALILLHPKGLSPEKMANLTRAGRLAAQYGAWVYLPEGQFQSWNDDPDHAGGVDDVAFLRRLIDSSGLNGAVDTRRIFIAGYSNGGFMAERAACELSSRIAGLATVAASLRDSVAATCRPSHHLPVIQFHGTGDLVIPYNGLPTISSAPVASAFWARQSLCSVGQTRANALPNASRDGTTVEVTRYSPCAEDSAVALFTIDHGGHTWPGATDRLFTVELGRTTSDIDATIELWRFFSPFSLR